MKLDELRDLDEAALKAARELPPPPPPKLFTSQGSFKAVRTRSRFGAFFLVLLLGAAWPAYTLLRFSLRRDLGALPTPWVVIGAVLWALACVLSLEAALVPRRGQVLPSAVRASRVSLSALGLVFSFTAVFAAHAPGVSLRPEDLGKTLIASCLGCGQYILQTAAVALVVGVLLLRRVLPMGARRIGLAIGAAGGALGGLALHFLCPIATTGHVLLSHVGTTLLASLAGALIFRGLLGR